MANELENKKYLDAEGLAEVFDIIESTYVNKEEYNSDKESTDKEIGDLNSGLEAETKAREEKDTELEGKITAEQTRAEAKETELDNKIDQEISDREEAIEDLKEEITNKKYFNGVEYVSDEKLIKFTTDGEVVGTVDTTDFIKDGMVESVELTTTTGTTDDIQAALKITFNTDAGKEEIIIPIGDLFDADNYYTKEEADEKFVPWTFENGRGRQIVLDNDGMILGLPNEGEQDGKIEANGACNLLMLNKWNVVDLGSTKYPINLNGTKGAHPTYNDNIEIAFVKDVEDSKAELEGSISELDEKIDAEITRATGKEEEIETNLASEVTRATTAETALDNKIEQEKVDRWQQDNEIKGLVAAEKERAEAKETEIEGKITALETKVDNAVSDLEDKIEAEATTREEEDGKLQAAIEAEVTRATEAEAALQESIDTKQDKGDYVEYTPYIEGRKTIQLRNYDSISGVLTTGGGVNLAMVSKWDVADFGSTQLPINLNGSKERPTYNDDKDIALLSDVEAEATKREQGDSNIFNELRNVKGTVTELENNLNSEIERATAKETEIETKFDQAVEALQEADQNLQNALNQEINDRIQGEENLQTNLAQQVAEAAANLQNNINAEHDRAVTAEQQLQINIDTLAGNIEANKYFNGVEYDSEGKVIKFTSNGEEVGTIDTTDFIKDGMVKNVELVDTEGTADGVQKGLKITFLTTSGTDEVILKIGDLFDAGLYITEEQVTNRLTVLENSIRNSINTIVTTTNGLSEKVGGLDARVTALEQGNGGIDTSLLQAAIVKNAADIATLNGDENTEGSVDYKIKQAIQALLNSEIKELFNEILNS